MKTYKKWKSFISLVCIIALIFSVCNISVVAADDNTVTATTNVAINQGATATCSVYIDSTEALAALDVAVHFDPERIKINSIYNSISCTLYDNTKNTDNIQFSYIFDGKGSASKTRLFYFSYQVLSNADIGDAYFDITIGEAYDNALNDVAVSGSRCNFTITKTATTKKCSILGTGAVSTAIEEEFSLNYRFSTYQIASGSAVINYDPELFEVVEVINGGFLANKIADVNAELDGAVYISFAGNEYNSKYDFITVKFKTLKNVDNESQIEFKATELHDLELNAISCFGFTTSATIVYDETFVGDAPKMSVFASYNESTEQVTAVICLEENSCLGVGDFVVGFDPDALSLFSYEKGFEPSFFNVNDKELDDGILKFSIISLEDITTEETVITLTFDANHSCKEQSLELDLSGSMIGDSLTELIALNLVDGKVILPEKHTYSAECDTVCNLCNAERSTEVDHTFSDIKDNKCNFCEYERKLESITISAMPSKLSYLEEKEPLDVTSGKIMLHYEDGSFGEINLISSMVSGFDNTKVGPQTLAVTYEGFTDTLEVEIIAKTLVGIELTAEPSNKTYLEAKDQLDVAGGKLRLFYNNDTIDEIDLLPSMVSGFDNSKPGIQEITVTYGGFADTFKVEVIGISSIVVNTSPDRLIFLQYEEDIDVSGGMFVITYANGETEERQITKDMVSGFDNTVLGVQDITVTYAGFTATYQIMIVEESLMIMELYRAPKKLSYLEGKESLNVAGGLVYLLYHDGTRSLINLEESMISGFDNTKVGPQTLVVTYEGKTTTFEVEIIAKTLTGIEITTLPNKTHYLVDKDLFSSAGGKLKLYYNNDTTEEIDLSASMVSGFDNTKIGKQTLTVSYKGYTDTFEVEIDQKSLVSIAVTTKPIKMNYLEGDSFNPSGMVVTAYFDNGTNVPITNYSVSGYDSTPGEKTIKVSYSGCEDHFIVNVKAKSIIGIELTTEPQKLAYLEVKDQLDVAGGKVTLRYDNNTTEEIDLSASMVSGFDNTKVGTQTLTITYEGFTDTFEVEILERPKAISGEVTFFGEGEATLRLLKNGETIQTVTTEDGAYLFEGIYAGDYTVEISKANHAVKTFELTVEEDDIDLDFNLYMMGDVNNNGEVTIADAVLILRVLNENLDAQYIDVSVADVVADGELTTADAILILRHIMGETLIFDVS